ncbi:MAG TPA: glycosyltransferase [Puia sp.]|nr:glycosyltransferase [Puia sp.]
MLDCRPLQLAGSDSEKYRLIVSAVAALSGDQAVEWLLLVDHAYRPGLLPGLVSDQPGPRPASPGSPPAPPTPLPGSGVAPSGPCPASPGVPSDRTRLLTARSLPGPLGWKLWYDWQLPRLVKRHKPDLLMLTGGVTAKPAGARQCVWMPVFANPKEAATMPAGSTVPIYAARLGNSVRQAETIFCFSEKDRSWLAGRGHIDAANILVVRPAPSPGIHPLPVSDKEAIRHRYTGGKEYFFVPAMGTGAATHDGEDQVVQLLKAFSLFKKRQLSNLQLVLAGTRTGSLRQRLETYKYRGDIHWIDTAATNPAPDFNTGHFPTAAVSASPATAIGAASPDDILSAAYAVLFPFEDGSLGTTLLNAWKAGTPALVARSSRLREMVDDAAVIAGVDDPAALAGYMMSVYKDETGRNTLIANGTSRLSGFDPSPSLAAIQTVVGREINKIN